MEAADTGVVIRMASASFLAWDPVDWDSTVVYCQLYESGLMWLSPGVAFDEGNYARWLLAYETGAYLERPRLDFSFD